MKRVSGVRLFVSLITLMVIVVLITAFFVVGSPNQERQRRFDEQRLQDLQQIRYAINNYWNRHQSLPKTLSELLRESGYYFEETQLQDPRTRQPYAYSWLPTSTNSTTTSRQYELCATFETNNADNPNRPPPLHEPYLQDWNHDVGKKCFTLEVQDEPRPDVKRY